MYVGNVKEKLNWKELFLKTTVDEKNELCYIEKVANDTNAS